MDDVRQLLHHFFKVGLEALVILKLVLFDQTLVYVQSHAASLDEMPAIISANTKITLVVWNAIKARQRETESIRLIGWLKQIT